MITKIIEKFFKLLDKAANWIDKLFKKFDVVGARFTDNVEDAELDQIIADCDGEEN